MPITRAEGTWDEDEEHRDDPAWVGALRKIEPEIAVEDAGTEHQRWREEDSSPKGRRLAVQPAR